MIVLIILFIGISYYFLRTKSKKQIKKLIITYGVLLFSVVCLRLGLGSVGLASLLYIIFSPFISRFNIEKYIKNFKENNSVRYNNSSMTIKEAEEILEVSKDASRDEIKQSYYKLMHKIHPDTGGTKYFANKLTEAYKMLINNK